MNHELIESVRDRNVLLFVGAGVSMNLGLPSYTDLIGHIASELGYDPDIFSSFGDHLSLAEFYQTHQGSLGPLRSWMDREWHSREIKIEDSEVHRLIAELNFPLIYTTNFDRWIENTLKFYKKPFIKISNVGDLAKIKDGIRQVVKFHGDFDDDASIVLTESSYMDRLGFESPLDIKLRSDVLGRTLLFVGYSLTDINIRYLLYRLQKVWDSSSCSAARPHSYIFLSRPNPVQERVLQQRGITAIVSEDDDPRAGLTKFLRELAHGALGLSL